MRNFMSVKRFLSAMIFHETSPVCKENKDYLKHFLSVIRFHGTLLEGRKLHKTLLASKENDKPNAKGRRSYY